MVARASKKVGVHHAYFGRRSERMDLGLRGSNQGWLTISNHLLRKGKAGREAVWWLNQELSLKMLSLRCPGEIQEYKSNKYLIL